MNYPHRVVEAKPLAVDLLHWMNLHCLSIPDLIDPMTDVLRIRAVSAPSKRCQSGASRLVTDVLFACNHSSLLQ